MLTQFGEASDDEELLACGRWIHLLMLEDPGVAMGNEDGVESGGERWVDVGLGAVADHPGVAVVAIVFVGELGVYFGVFFSDDLDRLEVLLHSGTLDFARLLFERSFGDEYQTIVPREILQRFGNFG